MSLIGRYTLVRLVCWMLFSSVSYAAMDAKDTYQTYCSVCHASGLAGAPKFRDKADWAPRCQTKKLQGLVDSAIKGINAMPAKGTCESCQVEDIREAIKYMVPEDEKYCHAK